MGKEGEAALAGFNETAGKRADEGRLEIICRKKMARRMRMAIGV